MGESLDTAVMNGVGKGLPIVHDRFRVVPSDTDSLGALLLISRLMGTAKSAYPETFTYTVAL